MGKYPYFPKVKTEWSKQQTFDGITIKEVTTPSENPPANYMKIYFKSDGKLYKLNSSGVETVSNSTVSAITQALLDAKANINNPTFTGVVAIPNVSNLETAVVANTAKVGITSGQASAITANTAKTGITSGQASNITTNNDKVGITSGQTNAIIANTAKTGITSGQSSAITANTAKISLTDNSVTLAKLAHGTADKYLGFDASGVPAELTVSAGGGQAGDMIIPLDTTLGNSTVPAVSDFYTSSDSGNYGVSVVQSGWNGIASGVIGNVIDGNLGTSVNFSGTSTSPTVTVDFGSNQTGVVKHMANGRGGFILSLETSTDGSSWTQQSTHTFTGGSSSWGSTITEGSSGSVTFRYARTKWVTTTSSLKNLLLHGIFLERGKLGLGDVDNTAPWTSNSESTPNVYYSIGGTKELSQIGVKLDRTLTTVTSLTIEYSTDTTFSGETVRTVLVSDFTDDTWRYLTIPRMINDRQYVRIAGVGTGVLSVWSAVYLSPTSADFDRKHFHKYLNPLSTDSNSEDSN